METKGYEEFVDKCWGGHDRNYTAIAFGGEVGEVLNEVKKELRDGKDRSYNVLYELGDALYYLTKLGSQYGFTLEAIMNANVKKLTERRSIQERSS